MEPAQLQVLSLKENLISMDNQEDRQTNKPHNKTISKQQQ
jgi:hypothetical protein